MDSAGTRLGKVMGYCECGNKSRKENLLKLHSNKTAYVREIFFDFKSHKGNIPNFIYGIFIFLKFVIRRTDFKSLI